MQIRDRIEQVAVELRSVDAEGRQIVMGALDELTAHPDMAEDDENALYGQANANLDELEKYRKEHKNKFLIQRYKGLGEMDANQLFETTMDPEHRVLKQVMISSRAEASSITSTLMGSEVAPRRQYIEENSKDAKIDS